jgi:hypothetical protein
MWTWYYAYKTKQQYIIILCVVMWLFVQYLLNYVIPVIKDIVHIECSVLFLLVLAN